MREMREILLWILRKFQGISAPCLIKQISTNMVLSTRFLSVFLWLFSLKLLLLLLTWYYSKKFLNLNRLVLLKFSPFKCYHLASQIETSEQTRKMSIKRLKKGLTRWLQKAGRLLWLLNPIHNTERWFCVERYNMHDILPKLLYTSTS